MSTAAEEAALAAAALDAGDPATARHHVAGALSDDCTNPEYLALADRLFAAVPDPLAFTAPGERPWFGDVALHARALAIDGRHTEAIHLILQVTTVRPDTGYLAWVCEWLDAPGVGVDPDALTPAVLRYLEKAGMVPLLDREPYLRIAPVLDRMCASWTVRELAWARDVVRRILAADDGTGAARLG